MKKIPNGTFDLTVTSPPYDNLRTYSGSLVWNENVWKALFNELYRTTKQGGVVVWVVNDSTVKGCESGTSFKQALYAIECGFNLHDTMIWHKTPLPQNQHPRYSPVFEYMFILCKGYPPKTFNPLQEPAVKAGMVKKSMGQRNVGSEDSKRHDAPKDILVNEMKRKSNIWYIPTGNNLTTSDKEAFKHPAIFPEKLATDHILSWSNPGDVVFDPFMGSGTTGKMAVLADRGFVGIEKVEGYFNIAKERINAAQAAKASDKVT